MDAPEIGAMIGAAVATSLSVFAARRATTGDSDLKTRVTELEGENKRLADANARIEARLKGAEEKLSGSVNEEAFSSYCEHTTETLQKMAEKIGRVMGMLETWAHRTQK